MTVEDDLLELVQTEAAATARLLEGATSALSRPVSAFQGWYDRSAITSLSELLGAILRGFEAVAARAADAYMANAISISTGKRYQPTGSRRTELGRIGVGNAEVVGRIANAYRWQQSQYDKSLLESVSSGKILESVTPQQAAFNRLNKITATNLQMAQRGQMLTTMAGSDKVSSYRRIIHPELATVGTCGLCIAASDRKYGKAELLPIHPECHCTVLPATRNFDPQSINEVDLGKLYVDAGSTDREDLRKTRYRVDDHGEIGPVIRPADEPIRTKKQAEKAERIKAPTDALARKRAKMAAELDSFRKRRDEFPGPEWDAVEQALANRVDELEAA